MMQFLAWLNAVRKELKALITGSLLLGSLGLYQAISGHPVRGVVYEAIASFFVGWAFYGAWASERREKIVAEMEVERLKEELEAERSKKIAFNERANVEIVNIGFVNDPFTPNVPFVVNVRFKNNGAIPATNMAMVNRIAIVPSSIKLIDGIPVTSLERKGEAEQEAMFDVIKRQIKETDYGNNSMAPSKEAFVSVLYPLPIYDEVALTESQIREIRDQQSTAILLSGIIKYIDAFGPRETHFCYMFSGRNIQTWSDGWGHNEII